MWDQYLPSYIVDEENLHTAIMLRDEFSVLFSIVPVHYKQTFLCLVPYRYSRYQCCGSGCGPVERGSVINWPHGSGSLTIIKESKKILEIFINILKF